MLSHPVLLRRAFVPRRCYESPRTIGNALRRVLLSSIEGAAITAVRIEGVMHEFSSIPGVVEDATDIILNLKQIPLKMSVEGPKTLTLTVDKPGEVTSRMIQEDADVDVLDKDVYIATVSEGGSLHIEMRVKIGRGYTSAEKNFDEDLPIGYIPVDSVHSPLRKVNYTVEAARLGQMTDYDKLTLDVWTNGAITPQDAVGLGAKLLKDHMNIFINFEEEPEVQEVAPGSPRARSQREPGPLRGRIGAFRSLLQLPEECQHHHHSGTGSEDRTGNAEDQELRTEISE